MRMCNLRSRRIGKVFFKVWLHNLWAVFVIRKFRRECKCKYMFKGYFYDANWNSN